MFLRAPAVSFIVLLLPIVIAGDPGFILLRLLLLGYSNVYWAWIYPIYSALILLLPRLIGLSVVGLLATPLSFLSLLELAVIDLDGSGHILIKSVIITIFFDQFVFNIFLKAIIESSL